MLQIEMEITRGNYHRGAPARALAALLAALLAGCGDGGGSAPGASTGAGERPALAGPHDVAVLELEGLGTIRFELYAELAPATVAHFAKLAREGFYDGVTFHRVIPGFMLQGGDPNTRDADPRNDGRGSPDSDLPREPSAWPHERGTVSWAASGRRPSGSQFFIVQADAPHLDGRHNVIGRVVEGIDVVDAVAALEIDTYGRYGPTDRPYPIDARIRSIRIEPAREQPQSRVAGNPPG